MLYLTQKTPSHPLPQNEALLHSLPSSRHTSEEGEVVHALPSSQLHALPSSRLHALPFSQRHALPSSQLHALPSSRLHALPFSQRHALPSSQLHALPSSRLHALPPSLLRLPSIPLQPLPGLLAGEEILKVVKKRNPRCLRYVIRALLLAAYFNEQTIAEAV